MSNLDTIKFNRILFTRESNTLFSIQANFDFGDSSLRVAGAEMLTYNEYRVNFDDSGSDSLVGDISFLPELENPAPDPNVQNAVSIEFYNLATGEYSSKKGNGKISGNQCPPPGVPNEGTGIIGKLDDYGIRIKTVQLQRTGGDTQVTITTENIDGGDVGYRIISNVEHNIDTASGPVQTWACEIQNDNTVDTNNTFQFDFSNVDAEVGLPILFYAQGTDINDVDQSDALLWIEQ